MTVWVYGPTVRAADDWARKQGVRPKDLIAFGNRSPFIAWRPYASSDRVVLLPGVDQDVAACVERMLEKSTHPRPVIERPGA